MKNVSSVVALAAAIMLGAAPLAVAQSQKSGTGLSPSGKMDGAQKQQKSGGTTGRSSSGSMQRGGSGGTSNGSPASGGMTK